MLSAIAVARSATPVSTCSYREQEAEKTIQRADKILRLMEDDPHCVECGVLLTTKPSQRNSVRLKEGCLWCHSCVPDSRLVQTTVEYCPTPEEIRECCRVIRMGWSHKETVDRYNGQFTVAIDQPFDRQLVRELKGFDLSEGGAE